jgi:putative protease
VVKIVELLAPARDMASLNSAINNGADSVYVGITGYNMRANVANFSIPDLLEAVKLCHDSNVKIYVCTNTVMKERDLIGLKNLMPLIKSSGADAIIASDLGALNIARENGIPVHMSVQANISNSEALNVLQELGVTRVVLSRENSLQEIKQIAENTNLDIEVFVHGAMCVAISGRCFLSSHLYDKSANCGECIQPCRKEWKLVSEDDEELIIGGGFDGERSGLYNEISYDLTDKTHILSPKDLCMIEKIPELIEAGVNVFKIEGRAKPADYVANVTRVYREAIDIFLDGKWNSISQQKKEEWKQDLAKVFNRGFDSGFYFRIPHETSNSNHATIIKKDIGVVVNYYQNVGAAEIKLWDNLELGEDILIQGKTTGSITMKVESMQVNGINIDKISKGQNVAIHVNEKVRPNDQVYKQLNKKLNPDKEYNTKPNKSK